MFKLSLADFRFKWPHSELRIGGEFNKHRMSCAIIDDIDFNISCQGALGFNFEVPWNLFAFNCLWMIFLVNILDICTVEYFEVFFRKEKFFKRLLNEKFFLSFFLVDFVKVGLFDLGH